MTLDSDKIDSFISKLQLRSDDFKSQNMRKFSQARDSYRVELDQAIKLLTQLNIEYKKDLAINHYLDSTWCCSGHDCGCMGVSRREVIMHRANLSDL